MGDKNDKKMEKKQKKKNTKHKLGTNSIFQKFQ